MTRKLFLQGPGLKKVQIVEVDDSAEIGEIVRRAREIGVDVDEDAVVLREDEDETLDRRATVDTAGLHGKTGIHVGRCRKVDVGVRYNGVTKHEDFSPARRLRHVFNWAIGKRGFDIPDGGAQDLVLVVPGQQQPLDLDDHVGTLVTGRQCEVSLDLVPSDRIQGER